MDLPGPLEGPATTVGGTGAGSVKPVSGPDLAQAAPAAPDVAGRLAALEAAVDVLGERVDALGDRVDAAAADIRASLREHVAREVGAAGVELRHTVSDLGRLLVRDLGRLPKILAEHRDAIVAELRTPGPRRTAPESRNPEPRDSAPTGPDPGAPDPRGPEPTALGDVAPGDDFTAGDAAVRPDGVPGGATPVAPDGGRAGDGPAGEDQSDAGPPARASAQPDSPDEPGERHWRGPLRRRRDA